jgi:putative endonuclease
MERRAIGTAAETAVAGWLQARGFEVVDRNVRLQRGELDLVVRRCGITWFVESKCRTRSDVGPPHRATNRRKRSALYAAAMEYRHRRRLRGDFGFLVASVVLAPGGREPIIEVARLPVNPASRREP